VRQLHATNLVAENKVHVIVNGDTESIDEFVDHIKNNDIKIKTSSTPHNVSGLVDYDGPDIDWNRYEIRFMTGQMTKGFRLANEKLDKIEKSLTNITDKS
jgi:hypothetical protein